MPSPTLTVRAPRPLTPPWGLVAAVAAGLADLGATTLYWASQGVPALRIPQSVAAWVLGREAYAGGMTTAIAGVVLFVLLVWGLVHLYVRIARAWRWLPRHPVRGGLAYGALSYLAIFHVAVPLFAVEGSAPARPDGIAVGLLACTVLIGLACAWAERRLRA